MSETGYRKFIPIIAQEDTDRVLKKDEEYGASWKKRGGVGAYMTMIRKVDRLEEQCKKHGYDIFKACEAEETSEGLLDTIRDLRSYLDLIEAEVRSRTMTMTMTMTVTPEKTGEMIATPGPFKRPDGTRCEEKPEEFHPIRTCKNNGGGYCVECGESMEIGAFRTCPGMPF